MASTRKIPITSPSDERMRVVAGAETPRVWVWRQLCKRATITTSHMHMLWAQSKEALSKWKADPVILEQALRALRDDGLICCSNGTWWVRDPA